MSDMKDAMRKAGFNPKSSDEQRGIPSLFPPDYPTYFDSNGVTRAEYVDSLADAIARRFGEERLTMHQLRAFYQYVKQREAALRYQKPWGEVLFELKRLKQFAHERARKNKVPDVFKQFIDRNIDKLTDRKSFERGFLEHFQAVVAYSAGRLTDREGQR